MCNAYLLSVQNCEFGELYLVGNSDKKYETTFDDALNSMLRIFKIKDIEIKSVPEFTRPTQVPFLISDCSKFTNISGWKPKLSLEDIYFDTLNYWNNDKRLNYDLNIRGGVHPL